MVGLHGCYACCYQAGHSAQRYLCTEDADAIVHSDHRGHGLLKDMTLAALNDLEKESYDFAVTLSGGMPYSVGVSLKLGWTSVGELRALCWRTGQNDRRLRQVVRYIPLLSRRVMGGRLAVVHERQFCAAQGERLPVSRNAQRDDAHFLHAGILDACGLGDHHQ